MLFEGAEDQSLALLAAAGWSTGTIALSTTTGVHQNARGQGGTRAFLNNNTSLFTPVLTSQHRYVAYSLGLNTGTSQRTIFLVNGTGDACTMDWGSTFARLRRGGGGGSIIATGVITLLRDGTIFWVTMDVICAAVGTFDSTINGVADITFSGNTTLLGVDGWDRVRWYCEGGAIQYLDDIVITTAGEGALGYEGYVIRSLPNGNGTPLQFTPSAGTNYQNVDETVPSTADYNETAIALDVDSYTPTAAPFTAVTTTATKVIAYVTRDGTLAEGRVGLKVGGTSYWGSWNTLGASGVYVGIEEYWRTNPNTAAAWSTAALDASEMQISFQ